MTARRRDAFTLVELLVVIAIIGLLTTILVPSFTRAREITRRTSCASGLGVLGKAALLYAGENKTVLPAFREANSDNSVVGRNRSAAAGVSNGNTRGWYSGSVPSTASGLVRGNYCQAEVFRCPSDFQAVRAYTQNPQSIYDFETQAGRHPVGYSLQVTKINSATGAGFALNMSGSAEMPIAADHNGAVRWDAMSEGEATVVVDPNESAGSNSPNHRREGQNVLRLGSRVTWEGTPNCGIDDDNIWAPGGGLTLSGHPAGRTDSYLMP